LKGEYVPPAVEFPEDKHRTVYDAISDLQSVPVSVEISSNPVELSDCPELSALGKQLRGKILYNHIATDSRETAKKRFEALKEGQNFHDLDASLKTTYSNADRTQNTIYMRLKYHEPSGTVVNVRKSMWIHPELDRAVSIREAARLQTFPDTFIFEGTKDSQYQQVGNAVPPILANAIARSLLPLLDANTHEE
jgi:DNA (cytosine-5)-methyltransferase 1